MDAIPIEELVKKTKQYAVTAGTKIVLAEITVLIGPIGGALAPFINWILEHAVEWIVSVIVDKSDKFLFGINMPLVTSDQGKDYREAVGKVLTLPDSVSEAAWEAAEMDANHAFDQLNKWAA